MGRGCSRGSSPSPPPAWCRGRNPTPTSCARWSRPPRRGTRPGPGVGGTGHGGVRGESGEVGDTQPPPPWRTHRAGEGKRAHAPLEGAEADLLQRQEGAGVPDVDDGLEGLRKRRGVLGGGVPAHCHPHPSLGYPSGGLSPTLGGSLSPFWGSHLCPPPSCPPHPSPGSPLGGFPIPLPTPPPHLVTPQFPPSNPLPLSVPPSPLPVTSQYHPHSSQDPLFPHYPSQYLPHSTQYPPTLPSSIAVPPSSSQYPSQSLPVPPYPTQSPPTPSSSISVPPSPSQHPSQSLPLHPSTLPSLPHPS